MVKLKEKMFDGLPLLGLLGLASVGLIGSF